MKIAMFEGYKRHPKRKRYGSHKRRRYMGAHRKSGKKRRHMKGVSAETKARRILFGKVARVCLVKSAGLSKAQKKVCMQKGMKSGIGAAQSFVK